MNDQSQVKPTKITALDVSHYIDSVVIPLKLSPIMFVLLSRMAKKLTFGARGVILDLAQILDESVSEYCDKLNIKEAARVSQAFSKLGKLNIVKSTRTKAGMDRQFHPEFIAKMIESTHAWSSTSQPSSCLTKHPPSAQSGTSQLPDQALGSLDRRLDERIDERMDGIKKAEDQPFRKVRLVDFAKDYQALFRASEFVDFPKLNMKLMTLFTQRGPEEMQQIFDYTKAQLDRLWMQGRDSPKFNLRTIDMFLNEWDKSKEKAFWKSPPQLSTTDFYDPSVSLGSGY